MEAVGEFIEVTPGMGMAEAMVSPQQESLGLREDGIDPRDDFGGLAGRPR